MRQNVYKNFAQANFWLEYSLLNTLQATALYTSWSQLNFAKYFTNILSKKKSGIPFKICVF